MALVGTSAAQTFIARAEALHYSSTTPVAFSAYVAPARFLLRSGSGLIPVRAGVRVGSSIVWLTPPL